MPPIQFCESLKKAQATCQQQTANNYDWICRNGKMYVNYFRMAWRTTTEMFRAGSGETLLQGVQAFSQGPLFSDLNYLSDSIR
jgi:hypothetical protein